MTSICLVRHGETDWNKKTKIQGWTDIPLNETGIKQAKNCSEHLAKENWDLIISSPLKRAKQTAEIINEILNVPLFTMEEFKERNYGDVEGMSRTERDETFPDRQYPNAEQLTDLMERAMKGIDIIHKKYNRKKVLLIAHGGTINAILAKLSDNKIGSGITKINNCSMTHIYHANESWHIKNYNIRTY